MSHPVLHSRRPRWQHDRTRPREPNVRVMVVGASGVVGRQLVPQLVAAGHEVVATSRQPREARAGVTYRQLDLLDRAATEQIVTDSKPDAIVHQATALSRLGNNLRRFDAAFATTNRLRTEGTATLIAAARRIGSPRLVVQSFCGWPWAPVGGPVKAEDDPWDPDPPRGFRQTFAALQRQEQLLAAYPNGVVLRYGGLYGPGTSLGPDGAQVAAVRRGWLPLIGDAGGIWSFVHTTDAASAAVAALRSGSGVYNVVDDNPAAVAEWLPELARLAGGPPPRRVPAWFGRLVGGEGLIHLMTRVRGSSNARARADLGWRPSYPDWRDGFAADLGGTRTDRQAA